MEASANKNKTDDRRLYLYLRIGLLGSVLSVLGDLCLGCLTYPYTGRFFTSLIAGCTRISDLRFGLGALLGAAGIPLGAFGFLALGSLVGRYSQMHERWMKIGAFAMAFWGAAVHVLCVAAMYLARHELRSSVSLKDAGLSDLFSLMPMTTTFACGVVLPVTVLLMLPYTVACVLLFLDVVRKKTILPAWSCICNPLLVKLLINLTNSFGFNGPVYNGIHMANMGIGAIICFGAVLFLVRRAKRWGRRV